MSQAKQKVLIGGGAGYIGTRLCNELVARGYDVTVYDLCWFGNYLPASVNLVKKELFSCTEEDLKGFDAFIFLAGLSNDPMAEYSPVQNFIYNGALPTYLAYVAKRAGVRRYVYASSCSVYGFTAGGIFTEDMATKSDYPYGISKLKGERGVMQLMDPGFSVIALRQATVCGFSPRMRMDLIINIMVKNALHEGVITVNNPTIWRPLVDIRDCIRAYVYALEAPAEISGVFNVSRDNYTVGQVAEMVKAGVAGYVDKDIVINTKSIADMRNYRVSNQKAKEELGFAPEFTPQDTVAEVLEGLPSLGNLDQDAYYNIRTFKQVAHPFQF